MRLRPPFQGGIEAILLGDSLIDQPEQARPSCHPHCSLQALASAGLCLSGPYQGPRPRQRMRPCTGTMERWLSKVRETTVFRFLKCNK